jgi:hypothetical protein
LNGNKKQRDMTREEKIKKITSAQSATAQTIDNAIFHTRDKEVAKWALENGMHVQGMNGVRGYSAYIWIDEPATEESFIA